MNVIQHIIEPNRLYLIWQAANEKDRKRKIVGEILRTEKGARLEYLVGTEDFTAAKEVGFEGYPAFPVGRDPHPEAVLETFLKRIPPRSRLDFPKYLENLRLPKDAEISDFALLGYSGARLPGDGFSVLPSFSDAQPPFEFLSEIAGFRYYAGLDDIEIGDVAEFEKDLDNPHDSNAIKVFTRGKMIGFVNRIHAPCFSEWMDKYSVSAFVERINGTSARPLVYLFVQVSEVAEAKSLLSKTA